MVEKYKDDQKLSKMINAESLIFRPTFLIETPDDAPYCEDEF